MSKSGVDCKYMSAMCNPGLCSLLFNKVEVLAVSKVLIAPTLSNFSNFGPEKDRQNSQNQFNRSRKGLAILFQAFLAYLPPFQSYGGFKKLERSVLLKLQIHSLLVD